MINALIIDDEEVAVNVLTLMIERHIPEITSIKSITSTSQALALIAAFKPDIVFLDIEMPYQNGFELLKSLPQISFDIIFTTAYDKYAIQAIKFSALDYLLKPIDADELRESFNRFIQKTIVNQNKDDVVKNLLNNLQQKDATHHKLALPTTAGLQFFLPRDIIRCEGMSNYTKFYFSNHHSITTSKTIKEYEEILLPHKFIRIHKSHLINAAFVKGYTSHNSNLVMIDGSQVEISRRRKKEVLQELGIKNREAGSGTV
ncbi:MAG: LytTR family DNA-binding domain-containing protein [Ginsengibacter sp.]